MIGVFVTFESDDDFDEAVITKIAGEASAMFEGMPGLRNKFFTLDEKHGRATNFYVWESEQAAREFFSEQLVERVTGLYGVRPRVEFAQVVGYVDNS
jgi:heme-degrading monooxygenase HmoA